MPVQFLVVVEVIAPELTTAFYEAIRHLRRFLRRLQ